jgi:hypothetical protein
VQISGARDLSFVTKATRHFAAACWATDRGCRLVHRTLARHRLDWTNDAHPSRETFPQLIDVINVQVDRSGKAWDLPGQMGVGLRRHNVRGTQSNAGKAFQLNGAREAKLLHLSLTAQGPQSRAQSTTLNSDVFDSESRVSTSLCQQLLGRFILL